MGKTIDFASLGRSLAEFAEIEFEELVVGLLHHPTLTLLYAPSGGMKSLFALDLARSVAGGGKFLGQQCKQIPVAYIDGEMGDASIGNRGRYMGIALPKEKLFYTTPRGEHLDFNDEDVQQSFIDFVKESDYRLVIFDNLRVLLGVENENDASCFYEFNGFIKQLRDNGCSVWVVHHANKGGEEYAGSSNLVTVFDYVIGLSGSNTDAYKMLSVKKVRDETGLWALDQQYLEFTPEGFKVNTHGHFTIELAVNELVAAIKEGKATTSQACQTFLREQGLSINNTGWSLKKLYDEYIHPHYCGDEKINSFAEFKDFLHSSRYNDRSVDYF